jgi:hypothetical protein
LRLDLLFKVSAETMLTIAADPKHLGATVGITSVLHTWGPATPAPVKLRRSHWQRSIRSRRGNERPPRRWLTFSELLMVSFSVRWHMASLATRPCDCAEIALPVKGGPDLRIIK